MRQVRGPIYNAMQVKAGEHQCEHPRLRCSLHCLDPAPSSLTRLGRSRVGPVLEGQSRPPVCCILRKAQARNLVENNGQGGRTVDAYNVMPECG